MAMLAPNPEGEPQVNPMTLAPADAERIVVIDDDYAMRLSCRQILAKSGFEVEVFEDGSQGLVAVAELKPALVVVDLKMPGLSGMEVIRRVQKIDPEIVLVVITGYATIGTAVEAMKSGAYDFLPKPFTPEELRLIVARGLERRNLHRKSRQLEVERELMKRRFVSFMTHQLKSPLAAIHQYLDVLKRFGDTPDVAAKRAEWLERCLARTAQLRELIDDWLLLAKAEGATLITRRERVDLKPVLESLLAAYEQQARASDVVVSAALSDPEYPVLGDRNCVTVLFDNLITNAIAYNRAGGEVRVSASREPGEVVVEVRDTGPGIPQEAVGLLFEEFFRLPTPEQGGNGESGTDGGVGKGKRSWRGTGLGLPICRRIVAELGGGIEVESEVEVGSTFRVHLPAYSEERSDADRRSAG
jgi:two-component system, sensor histidine kinase and response regulator